MGLFSLFRRKNAPAQQPAANPYRDEAVNFVYKLAFCDNPDLLKPDSDTIPSFPFNALLADPPDPAALQQLAADPGMEPRIRAFACQRLRAAGHTPEVRDLFAVIVEVGLEGGLDMLASYADGTARYINQSGKLLVWETTDDGTANGLTRDLFAAGATVLPQIGPWDKPRLPHPPAGTTRISFVVSDGLYFGQGPTDMFFADPLAQPALLAATKLMQYLTEQSAGKASG